jgi:hypothetical protein
VLGAADAIPAKDITHATAQIVVIETTRMQ